MSKSLTLRLRIRIQLSDLLTAFSWPGQRSGPRHDRNDGISRNLASVSMFGGEA